VVAHPGVDPSPNLPPKLGLLVSANIRTDGSDVEARAHGSGESVRWVGGFSYLPEKCNGGAIYDPTGALPTPDTVEAQIDVLPFAVEGSDTISNFGAGDDELRAERVDYARRNYLACEEKRISAELWKGTLTTSLGSGNRFLADSNAVLVEGDRLLGYITALAALEKAINDSTCGGQAMIHARADTISIWDAGGALRRVGNLILTIHDTIVVPGAGYDGTAPTGATGEDPAHSGVVPSLDSAWAYATSVVDLRRSAFSEPQSMLERTNPSSTATATSNVLTTRVWKVAAVTWGCLQVAVHVDHTAATTITGS
jgi:hypothetical protein